MRRALQRWILIGRGRAGNRLTKLGVEVTALVAEHPPELRRQGQPAGGREGLADLRLAELAQGPFVDPWGSERSARHSIMLARSTACRHGVGWTSVKKTSISSR